MHFIYQGDIRVIAWRYSRLAMALKLRLIFIDRRLTSMQSRPLNEMLCAANAAAMLRYCRCHLMRSHQCVRRQVISRAAATHPRMAEYTEYHFMYFSIRYFMATLRAESIIFHFIYSPLCHAAYCNEKKTYRRQRDDDRCRNDEHAKRIKRNAR